MMISTVFSRGTIIDCRLLTVRAKFIEMTEAQINQLAISFYEKTAEIFGDECYLNWKFEDRSLRDLESALLKQKKPNGCFTMALKGMVRSELIYNAKTLIADEIKRKYDTLPLSHYSQDYKAYFEQNIQNKDGEQLKDSVLKLFSETGRFHKGYYGANDMTGFFTAAPERETGLFYGDFQLNVSAYSLQSETDKIAGVFAEYLKHISGEFSNINSQISLNPGRSDLSWHCEYFYLLPSYIEATAENMRHWRGAMYTYLNGAEWFNIVSPKTLSRLPASTYPYDKEKVTTETLKNGALQVKCTADISKADVEDIKNAKLFLYNYLYPGMREFWVGDITSDVNFALRRKWEICPLLSDEVEVKQHKLILRHNGIYYPEKLQFDNW